MASSASTSAAGAPDQTYDVIIPGGGLAATPGIKRAPPSLGIAILGTRPRAQRRQVGESTVGSARITMRRAKSQKHPEAAQLSRARYFAPAATTATSRRRSAATFSRRPSHQLDRGRFENYLAENTAIGDVVDSCTMKDVVL
jgi:hypothetical protein